MPDRPTAPEPHPEFPVVLRGYDRASVDEHVRRLTAALSDAQARALAAEQRVSARPEPSVGFEQLGAHVAEVLRHASEEADRLRAEAEAYRQEAARSVEQARAQMAEEDAAAVARRDAVLAEARVQADELLQRAQHFADERVEEALTAAAEESAGLLARTEGLRADRNSALAELTALADRLRAAVEADAAGPAVVDLRDAQQVPR